MRYLLGYVFFFTLSTHVLVAQLELPKIFSDNMVLQSEKPIHIWGKGMPNTSLKIQFDGEINSTTVRMDATWSILFKSRKVSSKPHSIRITNGQQEVLLTNILIGDIWLCIGQSNMEWPVVKEMHFDKEEKNSNLSSLRFFNPTYAGKGIYNETFSDSVLRLLNTKNFYMGKWSVSDSNAVKQMSAVGYYFGKEILNKENIPIGLINLSIGGAPIETFVPIEVMKDHKTFSEKVNKNWLENDALPVWIRERGQQNVGNIKVIHQTELGPNHAFKPGFAFSAGIEPLLQMPIKGILWYQGESNAQELERVMEYGELQKLMIEDYRKQWQQTELPFYWVQLSSIDTLNYKSQLWGEFRNEQRKSMNEIKHGGMAVTSDIGAKNDVHPTNKKDVGNRLARWALNITYGKNILPSGPLPKEAIFKDGKIRIKFNYVGKGLITADGKNVLGFSLNGKDEVQANLKGNTVEISSLIKPKFVYYGWQPFSAGNLVNSEGLPATTFKLKIR